jgi:hypothetical protein
VPWTVARLGTRHEATPSGKLGVSVQQRPDVEDASASVALEQAHNRLRLPRGHVVVADDLPALQVALPYTTSARRPRFEHLPSNEVGG